VQTVFTSDNLERHLPTRKVGKTVLVYDSVDSTNDLLKPILSNPMYDGLTVFARYQNKGKGREGRIWQSPSGSSLLCSTLTFREGKITDHFGLISMMASVSTARTIEKVFHLPVRIKWPNDIFCGERKLSGILIESSQVNPNLAGYIIGIGVNVLQKQEDFPPELKSIATSVMQELHRPIDESEMLLLARELMMMMDKWLTHDGSEDIDSLKHDWLTLSGGSGHAVIVNRQNQTFKARIIDIDPHDNTLLVQDEQGLILHLQQNVCKIIDNPA
jgi:BirA family biotin operon repressor/biotin-[acetyl-CoA-carboxylase] ligase